MPTLGLCMIVKNGAATLSRCLASTHGLFDTMVIGDTGSADETAAIALSFGARRMTLRWRATPCSRSSKPIGC
jgi:glycosyltransferase involved in cell wall biosynthesis